MRNFAIFSVLKKKPFLFLWLGQVFSQVAINMMNFALVFRIYEATRSNTAVSFIVLSFSIPAVVLGMVAGVFVDRWDKRLVLVYCNVLRAFATIGFFISSESSFFVYLLAFSVSSITQFFVPAEAPTIPRIVPKDLLLTANSLFTLTLYASVIVGYMLSGPVVAVLGPKNIFILISILFAVAALFVRAVPPPENGMRIIEGIRSIFSSDIRLNSTMLFKIRQDLLEVYKFLRSSYKVMSAVLLMTISQALISSLAVLAPGFADKILSIKITDASIVVLGPAALGLLFGAFFIGQFGKKFSRERLIDFGIFGGGLSLLLMAFLYRSGTPGFIFGLDKIFTFLRFDSLHLAMVFLFILGFSNAFIDIPANTMLQENTREELRGRVYGVLTASIGGAAIFPAIIAGILADIYGVGRVVVVMAFLIFVFGMYRIGRSRKALT